MDPSTMTVLYPEGYTRGTTSIVFGENQLFPDLFSLSLLSTAHPLLLQQWWVRPSSTCYRTFNLAMDRSSDFGSTLSNCTPYSDPLSLRLPYTVKLATERKSLTHYTKGTRSRLRAPTVFMHAVSGSISLPSRGSFRLSLTVLVHYRSVTSISPWRMVPPSSDRISRVPPYFSYSWFHPPVFTSRALTSYGGLSHPVCFPHLL